jgi:hypothetical protein
MVFIVIKIAFFWQTVKSQLQQQMVLPNHLLRSGQYHTDPWMAPMRLSAFPPSLPEPLY